MNIFVILCLLIHLAMHQYLSNADKAGLLAEHYGFLVFVMLSNIFYAGNLIYIFGFLWGSLIFLSSFCFSLPSKCLAWPFQILIMKSVKNIEAIRTVLAVWSIGVWGLLLLFILNCFISKYASWKIVFQEHWLAIILICIVGNILRLAVIKIAQNINQ